MTRKEFTWINSYIKAAQDAAAIRKPLTANQKEVIRRVLSKGWGANQQFFWTGFGSGALRHMVKNGWAHQHYPNKFSLTQEAIDEVAADDK